MSNTDRYNKMKTKNWLDLTTQKQLNSPISALIEGILSGGTQEEMEGKHLKWQVYTTKTLWCK